MRAPESHPDLAAYYREAASWDADHLAVCQVSARRAWQVAIGGALCALLACAALVALLPLKQVQPFLIRVDSSTGVVDVVPVYAGRAQLSEAVTRYLLTHYVLVCERFNYATAESDYEECGAFHTAARNQAWYARWNSNNPASPLNLHKDGSSVSVQIESVSFFRRANGTGDLAQVRYLRSERQASGVVQRVSHWIATVQYAFGAPSSEPRVRRWNPLGFKIIEFVPEPEVLHEDPETPANSPGRVQP